MSGTCSSPTSFPRPGRVWSTPTSGRRHARGVRARARGPVRPRIGVHLRAAGHRVDPVPERRAMAARHGVETLDYSKDVADELRK